MLDDLALPGDNLWVAIGPEDGAATELCGDAFAVRSSVPPSMDNIDIPVPGLCDAKLGRSRTPMNGDVAGGPRRGAPCREEEAGGGICGGDGGGGMLRDPNEGGGGSCCC